MASLPGKSSFGNRRVSHFLSLRYLFSGSSPLFAALHRTPPPVQIARVRDALEAGERLPVSASSPLRVAMRFPLSLFCSFRVGYGTI
jgi:hypothetical protein